MKIVIVGYGEMLQSLISGVMTTNHEIVGVFRHENVLFSRFKNFFMETFQPTNDYLYIKHHKLNDIKATSVNSKEFRSQIEKLGVDLILVGSWSEKFEMQTINIPKVACINVHPSLLPKYRGPNPYIQTLLANEKVSGITFHLMDVNYDTGGMLFQSKTNIDLNETGATLKSKCCALAKTEVANVLNNIELLVKNPVSQNEKEATYQHQIKISECILNFEQETSEQISRRIRALTPFIKCVIPHKKYQFLEFEQYKTYNKPTEKEVGSIIKITNNSIFVVCKDKKVMEFIDLKLKMIPSKFFTKLYINKFVKIGDKAI